MNQVRCLPRKIYILGVAAELQSEYLTARWTTPRGSASEISDQCIQSGIRDQDGHCVSSFFNLQHLVESEHSIMVCWQSENPTQKAEWGRNV